MEEAAFSDRSVEILARHLIAICVTYRLATDEKGEPNRFIAAAGCLIDIRGQTHILTAGHVINDIQKLYEDNSYMILNCCIADTFGPLVSDTHPIPFDFENSDKVCLDDRDLGLDFGVVFLKPYYVRLLQKNHVIPLDENAWKMGNNVALDHYFVLGFPEEYTSRRLLSDENAVVSTTLIRLNRIEYNKADFETKYERFVATIDEIPLATLRGMSGGPIFAFDSNNLDRYWIVAIQSSWLPKSRKVFGCLLSVAGGLVYKWADDVLADLDARDTESIA